jgi:hypothetical protein
VIETGRRVGQKMINGASANRLRRSPEPTRGEPPDRSILIKKNGDDTTN